MTMEISALIFPGVKGTLHTSLDQTQCKPNWMLSYESENQGHNQSVGGQDEKLNPAAYFQTNFDSSLNIWLCYCCSVVIFFDSQERSKRHSNKEGKNKHTHSRRQNFSQPWLRRRKCHPLNCTGHSSAYRGSGQWCRGESGATHAPPPTPLPAAAGHSSGGCHMARVSLNLSLADEMWQEHSPGVFGQRHPQLALAPTWSPSRGLPLHSYLYSCSENVNESRSFRRQRHPGLISSVTSLRTVVMVMGWDHLSRTTAIQLWCCCLTQVLRNTVHLLLLILQHISISILRYLSLPSWWVSRQRYAL